MSFQDCSKQNHYKGDPRRKIDAKQVQLEKEILDLASSIAEESYHNHQRLNEQGESINSWNKDEDQMTYQLKKSDQYLKKIGAYANRITKFFTKDYYYPPVKEETERVIKMQSIDFDSIEGIEDPDNPDLDELLNLNLVDEPDTEFEENLKKKLEIIKNIQLTISDQLDDQIEELKHHNNTVETLDDKVKDLSRKIDQHLH